MDTTRGPSAAAQLPTRQRREGLSRVYLPNGTNRLVSKNEQGQHLCPLCLPDAARTCSDSRSLRWLLVRERGEGDGDGLSANTDAGSSAAGKYDKLEMEEDILDVKYDSEADGDNTTEACDEQHNNVGHLRVHMGDASASAETDDFEAFAQRYHLSETIFSRPPVKHEIPSFHDLVWGTVPDLGDPTVREMVAKLMDRGSLAEHERAIVAAIRRFHNDALRILSANTFRLLFDLIRLQNLGKLRCFEGQFFKALPAKSIEKCVDTLAHLVIMLVRAFANAEARTDGPMHAALSAPIAALLADPSPTTVHRLILALFDPANRAENKDGHVVLKFVLFRCVQPSGKMAGPSEVCHLTACLIYSCRLAVAYHFCLCVEDPEDDDKMWDYVTFPKSSPFGQLYSLHERSRNDARKAFLRKTVEFLPDTADQSLVVLGKDVVVTLELLRCVVRGLKQRLRSNIKSLIFDLPFIEASSIPVPVQGSRCRPGFTEVPDCSERLRRKLFDNRQHWNPQRFMATVEKVLEDLLVLVHLISGVPMSKFEELSAYSLYDGMESKRRVRVKSGLVMLFQPFAEAEDSLSWNLVHICRFLDPESSSLLLTYLSYVRPVELGILSNTMAGKTDEEISSLIDHHHGLLFVHEGVPFSDDRIRRLFSSTCASFGAVIDMDSYYHAARAFALRHLDLDEPVRSMLASLDIKSANGERTAMILQSRDEDSSGVASWVIEEEFYQVSTKWHALLNSPSDHVSSMVVSHQGGHTGASTSFARHPASSTVPPPVGAPTAPELRMQRHSAGHLNDSDWPSVWADDSQEDDG